MSELETCKICSYTSAEVTIVNELCSVHTCETCRAEGYATALNGRIFCDDCHLDEAINEAYALEQARITDERGD